MHPATDDPEDGLRASVFIATSLDGFIARPNGELDWLTGSGEGPDPEGPPEDLGYDAFIATVDTLVMGRSTFEKVRTFERWPYGSLPVVVLSSRGLSVPANLARTVESMAGSPEEIVASLAARGARHVYVDGGVTIQRFLAAGLIDRMVITRIPVLIGQGIPLFGSLPADVRVEHTGTTAFSNGLVQSSYSVVRTPPPPSDGAP